MRARPSVRADTKGGARLRGAERCATRALIESASKFPQCMAPARRARAGFRKFIGYQGTGTGAIMENQ